MLNVEDDRYGILEDEQAHDFVMDIKRETEHMASNTQNPPGIIHRADWKDGDLE